jgi:hypothetical protein
MTTAELIALIGLIVVLCSFGGAIVYNILLGKFITPAMCKEKQADCQKNMCTKIHGVRDQIFNMSQDFKDARENSESKRDEARKEYAGQIRAIYDLIERTEAARAQSLKDIHTFMGEVRTDIKALKNLKGRDREC